MLVVIIAFLDRVSRDVFHLNIVIRLSPLHDAIANDRIVHAMVIKDTEHTGFLSTKVDDDDV